MRLRGSGILEIRRNWVLSLPFDLRYRMAYDARLTSGVLNVFIRALFGELRRRAHRLLGLRRSRCGAVAGATRSPKPNLSGIKCRVISPIKNTIIVNSQEFGQIIGGFRDVLSL